MRSLLYAALLGLAASCSGAPKELPPRGQIVLYFDTDAPVPTLFDRLRVDVAACEDSTRCPPQTRDFAVDEAAFRERRVSIGIVAADAAWVRARLFLFAGSLSTEPPPDVTIDVDALLPPIASDGVIERTLFLATDHVSADKARVELREGPPEVSSVGSWPGAARVDCSGAPGPGEVCVPGGAFWMGSARLRDDRTFLDPAPDTRRLVVMSPFFVDAHEVTVAELRAMGTPALARLPVSSKYVKQNWCTFSADPGADNLPANCLAQEDATKHCAKLGKELPTEAQFEYLASNLGRSLWPWGDEIPSCTDAVLARSYGPPEPGHFTDSSACRGSAAIDGPLPVGSMPRDRVDLPGGSVFDLVGNVSEFTRDIYQHKNDDCWSRRGVYVDPTCTHSGVAPFGYVTKGGNFWWQQGFSFGAMRYATDRTEDVEPLWGFRCVRTARNRE